MEELVRNWLFGLHASWMENFWIELPVSLSEEKTKDENTAKATHSAISYLYLPSTFCLLSFAKSSSVRNQVTLTGDETVWMVESWLSFLIHFHTLLPPSGMIVCPSTQATLHHLLSCLAPLSWMIYTPCSFVFFKWEQSFSVQWI